MGPSVKQTSGNDKRQEWCECRTNCVGEREGASVDGGVVLTVDTYHKCPGTTAGQVSPQCLPNLSSCGLLPFCSLSFSQVDLCDQPYDLLLFVSDCAVAGTNGSPHQHHGRERALPDHWDHLWLLSLRPSVNPYQVANELGYQNLGEVVAFPGHFVFRSRQKARCRQLVSLI